MSEGVLEIFPAPLYPGSIEVSGFKHLAVLLIAASVAVPSIITIENVPNIDDVSGLSECIRVLGGKISRVGHELTIDARALSRWTIPEEILSSLHGPLYLVPVVLGRVGEVAFGQSGGCQIGEKRIGGLRPVRQITEVLERFGAKFKYSAKGLVGYTKGFKATDIDILKWSDHPSELSGPLVSGATKTAVLASMFVRHGTTTIRNPDRRSEVIHLLSFLRRTGMNISEDGNEILIDGSPGTNPVSAALITDLIEVVTYISLSAYMQLPLRLTNVSGREVLGGLKHEMDLLTQIGVDVRYRNNTLFVEPHSILAPFDVDLSADSIYSDSQPFFALVGLRAQGVSSIRDRVWRNRFAYVEQLIRLGAKMSVHDNKLTIFPGDLHSRPCKVFATDLRATAVLILAALGRSAPTRIEGTQHLSRGYDKFTDKLRQLGALILEAN